MGFQLLKYIIEGVIIIMNKIKKYIKDFIMVKH